MLDRIRSRRVRAYTAGLASLLVLAAGSLAASGAQAGPPTLAGAAAVEPQLRAELATAGSTDFWVYLRESADLGAAARIDDRAAQGRYVYEQLTRKIGRAHV